MQKESIYSSKSDVILKHRSAHRINFASRLKLLFRKDYQALGKNITLI